MFTSISPLMSKTSLIAGTRAAISCKRSSYSYEPWRWWFCILCHVTQAITIDTTLGMLLILILFKHGNCSFNIPMAFSALNLVARCFCVGKQNLKFHSQNTRHKTSVFTVEKYTNACVSANSNGIFWGRICCAHIWRQEPRCQRVSTVAQNYCFWIIVWPPSYTNNFS